MADSQAHMPVQVVNERSIPVHLTDGSYLLPNTLTKMRSMNNRLIVEAYQKQGLQTTISQGFAFIEQKVSLKGLKVLIDAKLADGTIVLAGSTAYIKEEVLHTAPWAQKSYQCDTFLVPFMPIDATHVDFITPPGDDAA